MRDAGPDIGVMTRSELAEALDWAAEQGWDPAVSDAACLPALDAQGLLAAREDGRMVGCLAALRCGPAMGRVSLLVVRPAARGRGVAQRLWDAAVAHLGPRCLVTDEPTATPLKWRWMGEPPVAWLHRRYVAQRPVVPPVRLPLGLVLSDAHDAPFERLLQYDSAAFAFRREAFLAALVGDPRHATAALLDVADRVRGFGVLRPTRGGSRVGPLLADGPVEAGVLLGALLRQAPPGPVSLDVREDHAFGVALARQAGMTPLFTVQRLYSSPPPPMRRELVYAISGYEMG